MRNRSIIQYCLTHIYGGLIICYNFFFFVYNYALLLNNPYLKRKIHIIFFTYYYITTILHKEISYFFINLISVFLIEKSRLPFLHISKIQIRFSMRNVV